MCEVINECPINYLTVIVCITLEGFGTTKNVHQKGLKIKIKNAISFVFFIFGEFPLVKVKKHSAAQVNLTGGPCKAAIPTLKKAVLME